MSKLGWAGAVIVLLLIAPAKGQTTESTQPSLAPATTQPSPQELPATEPASTPSPAGSPASEPTTQPGADSAVQPTSEPTTQSTTEPATLPIASTSPSTFPATTCAVPEDLIPPALSSLTGLPEGTYLKDQVGRVARTPNTREIDLLFDFAGKQTRIPLLQSLRLMQIEKVVATEGWTTKFRISGTITDYKGRNYLMLERVARVEDER